MICSMAHSYTIDDILIKVTSQLNCALSMQLFVDVLLIDSDTIWYYAIELSKQVTRIETLCPQNY